MPQRSRILAGVLGVAIIVMLAESPARGDVPRSIHYQGKLRDSTGAPVEGAAALRFRLYDSADGAGAPLFDETHAGVAVQRGLFSVLIGSQVGGVPDSALNAPTVYLSISVNGGTELTPRTQVVSTAHAVKARSAEQLVKPDSFAAAATIDGSGSLDMPTDGATVRMPRKSTSGDPAQGEDGMIYYNAADGKFRVHEGGAWGDMRGGSEPSCTPCGGWSLVGARSSYVGLYPDGYVGMPIDISDPSKEYMIAYAGSNSSGGEHYFSGSPEAVVMKFKDSNSGAVLARETNNAWYTFSSNDTLFIEQGATWSGAASGTIIYNVDIYGSYLKMRIFGDGSVRYWDDGTEPRCTNNGICNWGVVLVFSR